jgi:hypothetical protein
MTRGERCFKSKNPPCEGGFLIIELSSKVLIVLLQHHNQSGVITSHIIFSRLAKKS